ncbi:MAG TPA: fluoride efflux transporter CrcB [Alphaproteobacteria bacterium]|nr:fluoride efflux transporter CrcB [Micavibrio sp.]MBK9561824.1 fluoride efflux transporter CrcB [Micavibrio sp.]HQX28061.1 fluoride efflux transporter CrcB [Alphaproteobacteria bacterium]
MKTILAIALGGALGSVLRYGTYIGAGKMLGMNFPWGTLIVNIVGSFLIGALTGMFASVWQPSEEMKLFLITGFLGGFTTFSAFSLDFANLWNGGTTTMAVIYVVMSVTVSIVALFAGLLAVRFITP